MNYGTLLEKMETKKIYTYYQKQAVEISREYVVRELAKCVTHRTY